MITLSISLFYRRSRRNPYYYPHLPPDLALWLTLVVVVQFITSVQGVLGYETITGRTHALASVRRLSSVGLLLSSVFLAVVESGRRKGGESCATVQGLGNSLVLFSASYLRDIIVFILLALGGAGRIRFLQDTRV